MRLYSYIIRYDRGLAPNPFWGYCTIALCTPNHMGIRAQKGDWIIGSTTKERGNRLLYAMEISEKMSFEKYYLDERFENKKPAKNSIDVQRVGDNMYYKDDHGNWEQHPTDCHNNEYDRRKDLRYPFVFIGERFYYFGKNAIDFPVEFRELIRTTQGCKSKFSPDVVNKFLKWLSVKFDVGIHGEPYDKDYRIKRNLIRIDEL